MKCLDISWQALFQALYVSLVTVFLFIKGYLENLTKSCSVLSGAIFSSLLYNNVMWNLIECFKE